MISLGKIVCIKDSREGTDKWGISWSRKIPLTIGKEYDIYSISHFWGCYVIVDDNGSPAEYDISYFLKKEELTQLTREEKLNTILKNDF